MRRVVWNMNGVAGLAPAGQWQVKGKSWRDRQTEGTKTRRTDGDRKDNMGDGKKAWPEAQVPANRDRYGQRYVPVRTWTRGSPTSTRLQVEAEV